MAAVQKSLVATKHSSNVFKNFLSISRFQCPAMNRLKKRNISIQSYSEPAVDPITIDKRERITLIGLNRPQQRNAVNQDMAQQLTVAFQAFENDKNSNVAVLHGKGEHFCSGYDLKQIAQNETTLSNISSFGAMGPTRLYLRKPVIAAVNGFAVAGGLELALLCDMRVFEKSTKVGVLCRRFGIPLIDGGTVRLPALIGLSNALDLILTGRLVDSDEASRIGLANRVVEDGEALSTAVTLANEISRFPQACVRSDRDSAYYSVFNASSKQDALDYELKNSLHVVGSEAITGAKRFESGEGRSGSKL